MLGTILINQNRSNLEIDARRGEGIPKSQADQIAEALVRARRGGSEAAFTEHGGAHAQQIFAAIQHDFALSTRTVFYCDGRGRWPSPSSSP